VRAFIEKIEMQVQTAIYLALSAVTLFACAVIYLIRYASLVEEMSLREFISVFLGCLLSAPAILGGTLSGWINGKDSIESINAFAYFILIVVTVIAYARSIKVNTGKKKRKEEEKNLKIELLSKQNSELHDSLHNYFHPHLADLYKFYFDYGNGSPNPTYDWGYRRLNLFLFDSENQSILNLSRYVSFPQRFVT
jgi:hypothetical protein